MVHTIYNIPLSLHTWDVDFAVWCTYKYLNTGHQEMCRLLICWLIYGYDHFYLLILII